MFDWNDEELTNIIWGEEGENDDHIVPFPDQVEEKPPFLFGDPTKKETNQQTSSISPVKPKKPAIKSEHVVGLDKCSKYVIPEPTTGFGLDPWPDGPVPSSSNAAKADPDSTCAASSKSITKSSKTGSLGDETAHFDKDSEIFVNPPEDGEQSDLVDYGWANIGSFDDLDRIFSNNDPIFGDVSAVNADELWSSTKDVTSSPGGPTPLYGDSFDLSLGAPRSSTDQSEIKAENMLDPSQSFVSGYEKLNENTSHAPLDVQASIDTIEHYGGKSNLVLKEKNFLMDGKIPACYKQLNDGTAAAPDEFPCKGNRQKRSLKSEKKSQVNQLHDLSGKWSSSGLYSAPTVKPCPPPLVLSQQSPLLRPEPFQQKHFSVAPLAYGNMVVHYPAAAPVVASGYDVPPANTHSLKSSDDAQVKPPPMTPEEKIEKLRRRQQMRAILAIQRQQLQFSNQASVSGGGKIVLVDDENLGNFPNSPVEQDDSNTISMAFDNCSVEESMLYRLQNTIAKLDMRIRLCIRDSLFRLARGATQRQYCPNDTSSTSTSSRDEVLSSQDLVSHERITGMPDVETDTNPIDRIVAHLLFHRPLDFSGKLAETPDSPLSAGIPYERKASLTKGYFPENFENTQMTSPQGSKSPGIFSEGDQSKNDEKTDGGQKKVEKLPNEEKPRF